MPDMDPQVLIILFETAKTQTLLLTFHVTYLDT